MNRSSHLPFDAAVVHSSPTDELEDLAAAYALESMELQERGEYDEHLSRCGQCLALVGEFQEVADLLPESLEDEDASDGLKESILSHARADLQTDVRRPAQLPVNEARSAEPIQPFTKARPVEPIRLPSKTAWLAPASLAIAAGLIVAVVGLILWNLNIQSELTTQIVRNIELESDLNEQRRIVETQTVLARSIATGAMVSSLPGTDAAPQATGRLVQDVQTGEVFLLAYNLPSIAPTQQFQVWHIAEGVPTSAGTFTPTSDPVQIVRPNTSFTDAEAVGVSIEPVGGSTSPTGDIVLLGSPE